MYIYIYTGWWFQPLWKIWKSMERNIPYIMEIEFMFQTTNQIYYIAYELWLAILLTIYWLYIITTYLYKYIYIYIHIICILIIYIYISGWWFQPLWKIWVIIKMGKSTNSMAIFNSKLLVYRRVYIYIYIWVNYNISLTWIKASHGEDSPKINHD